MALTTERPTEAELPDVRPPSTIYTGNTTRNTHPRSVVGKLTGVVFQPVTFFRSMPANSNRHYLWIALLTLVLISASAVHQTTASQTGGMPSGDPGMMGGGGMPVMPGGAVKPFGGSAGGGGGFPGEMPPDGGQGLPTAPTVPVSEVWTTVLLACAGMVGLWLTQTFLLSEVSLFNSMAPNLGRNFQIAVWASLPLGLMGGIQLLYQSAGGQLGQPGLSGLVDLIPGYVNMPEPAQQALVGVMSHLTLFGLWSLLLLYLGARYGLNGKRITSLLVVTLWLAVVALAPVAFESLKSARRAARNPVNTGIDSGIDSGINGDINGDMSSETGSTDSGVPDAMQEPTNNPMVDPQSPSGQEVPPVEELPK